MTTPETLLRDKIRAKLVELRRAGEPVEFMKVLGGATTAGQPDWILCYHGRMICLESKCAGYKQTDLQIYRMAQWAKAGAAVGVVGSVDDVLEILARVKP